MPSKCRAIPEGTKGPGAYETFQTQAFLPALQPKHGYMFAHDRIRWSLARRVDYSAIHDATAQLPKKSVAGLSRHAPEPEWQRIDGMSYHNGRQTRNELRNCALPAPFRSRERYTQSRGPEAPAPFDVLRDITRIQGGASDTAVVKESRTRRWLWTLAEEPTLIRKASS